MPAQSKQQQKFMGLVHAIQKGDVPASDASPEALKVAQDMNPSDVKDFASTSHKGLPKKVKQEIVKKLKEYAMTLPNHHAKPSAPMEPLRSDDEMDLQKETRIPQNFNVGTTRDYHTKLATTPRKKYDKTNFNTAHSGQEDLEEAGLKGVENIPSNKKLSQLSDNDKLKIVQSSGNLISFKVPDWSKGKRNFWTVISNGKIVKKKNLNGETIFILPGKGPEKVSPSYPSVKELLNGVDWETMELKREPVNEASMPPVRKVVNAILKKHGVVPMKTTSTSVRGFHNIQRGGYRYEGNYFLGFYGVPQDIIDKVGDEMKKAGVKGVDVRKGIISADFTINGLKESVNETQAISGGKVHKFITGKNLGFKGKKYSEIEFETLGVDNKNGTIRLKILAPKEIFGNEINLDFRSVRRGPYFKTDTSKVNEASPCWDGYKQIGMKNKGGRQVPNCVKESVNELKLNDLVGNQYKYVIGSGEEKYLGKNDKKYVLEMIAKSLKTYLYDDDFALNYLNGSQRREYNTFFEKEVLTPMLKKVDFTLNNFFTLDKDKVKWKLSSNDTRKMIDEIFRKNSKVPSDIKKEYYKYRLEYAGVKLKESVNEASTADVIKDLDKVKNDLLKKVDVLVAKKKKLYSNIDIESPMNADEKKLDKDIADLFSQINKLVLQKRNLKEYGQALDLHFILNKDAKLDGTPEPKRAIDEELDFDEEQMVIGIIEILKQVEDPKNRMKIALNMLKKFKEENIEFDYQKFVDALKEYSMGSYEYDKGSRELGESMIKSMKDVVIKSLPTNTLARHASDPNKNKEFVSKIVRELGSLLNRFYKQNDIDVVLK